MDVKRGTLIAFEGVDGSGKSTQIDLLASALRVRGCAVESTFEPTDGEMGKRIRAMARSGETIAPETELAWLERAYQTSELGSGAEHQGIFEGRTAVSTRLLRDYSYDGATLNHLRHEIESEFSYHFSGIPWRSKKTDKWFLVRFRSKNIFLFICLYNQS